MNWVVIPDGTVELVPGRHFSRTDPTQKEKKKKEEEKFSKFSRLQRIQRTQRTQRMSGKLVCEA